MILFIGCMNPGRILEPSAIAQVREGQTQAEVRAIFGNPKQTKIGSDGRKLDIFGKTFFEGEGIVREIEVRSMHVLYGPDGTVEKFKSHVGKVKGRAGEHWQIGRLLVEDEIQAIERGSTVRDELIQIFGPPTIEGIDLLGNTVNHWLFIEGKGGRAFINRELAVIFNDDLIVQDFFVNQLEE